MIDNIKQEPIKEEEVFGSVVDLEEMHLDDARRVKVLSPGMLVFKRFIRNKLAVVGFGILLFMFLFAFLGPVFSPYSQTQVFKGVGSMSKDFAGATYNTELRYSVAAGETFGSAERAQFLLALGKNNETFSVGDEIYYIASEGEGVYRILKLNPVAQVMGRIFTPLADAGVPDGLFTAYQSAIDEALTVFELEGVSYRITKINKLSQISTEQDVALATLNIYD